jgi:ribosomal protein S18 acetylase RimI-like enzyme
MVREIRLSDKEEWEVLYRGYADFYKVEMKDEILKTVWSWLQDRNHDVKGIVYEHENKVVGLAHYRRMPRPLRGKYIGFLDDIYVEPKYRGKKIGEKLIHELNEISKKNNWGLVRWVTRNDNIRAKSLYDRIAKKTTWDLYELK